MNARETAPMSQVSGGGGAGAGGIPPPQQQIPDVVDLAARVDAQFVQLRRQTRENIFQILQSRPAAANLGPGLLDMATRLEHILYRKYQNKMEYFNMTKGPIEQHLRFATEALLSARYLQHRQNQQSITQIASYPGYGTMNLTPSITQSASENSRMSYVTGNVGPLMSGAYMVPQNADMVTLLPGATHDEHVNTIMFPGLIPTRHDHSAASNNNLVMNLVESHEIDILLACPAPMKDLPREPNFSCPVCMSELVNASSTICGHIFCQKCIETSIKAQRKCPTCRKTLTMRSFHRVYLPMMD